MIKVWRDRFAGKRLVDEVDSMDGVDFVDGMDLVDGGMGKFP